MRVNGRERSAAYGFDERNVVRAIEGCLAVRSPEQLCHWTRSSLQSLIPHRILVWASASNRARAAKSWRVCQVCSPHAPSGSEASPGACASCPFLQRWYSKRKPLQLGAEITAKCSNPLARWLMQAQRVRNGVFHAFDMGDGPFSHFCVSGLASHVDRSYANALEMLVANMHAAAMRLTAEAAGVEMNMKAAHGRLTAREAQILYWLHRGKTNWEIARVLSISDKTVKNHVHNILVKLDARNRLQIVTKAMAIGVITPTNDAS